MNAMVRVGLWLARLGGWTPPPGVSGLPLPPEPAVAWADLVGLYATTFGPLFRAPALRPLLADLEWHAFVSRSTTEDALDSTGRVDPVRLGAHEGRRTFLLRLKQLTEEGHRPSGGPPDATTPFT